MDKTNRSSYFYSVSVRMVRALTLNFSFLSFSCNFYWHNSLEIGLRVVQLRGNADRNFKLPLHYVLGQFEILRLMTPWIVLHSVLSPSHITIKILRWKSNELMSSETSPQHKRVWIWILGLISQKQISSFKLASERPRSRWPEVDGDWHCGQV